MRKYGMENPYELLKSLTRGNKIEKDDISRFISSLKMPENEK
jgi:adenylosuccinate lyase